MKYALLRDDELQPGELRTAELGAVEVVVLRTPAGEYRVLRDRCPHYGVKLSGGRVREWIAAAGIGGYQIAPGRFVVECPWHGYEFDVDDGHCPADPEHLRVRSYPVTVTDGIVYAER